MKIDINEFVKRQTPDSEYSHFEGTWTELINLVEENFTNQTPGYRDGVILISVPPERFKTTIVNLKKLPDDACLIGKFKERREEEEPYLKVFVTGNIINQCRTGRRQLYSKPQAKKVDIVLYRHDVLKENNEQSTDAEWEIISINANPDEQEVPMSPMTRARNVLEMKGGTNTKLEEKSKEELIQLIKDMAKETVYWNQHAILDT